MTEIGSDVVAVNCALARQFFAEQDRQRGGPAEALCTPDYVALLGGQPPVDRAGHEAFATAFYRAFEGLHHTLEDVFATDSRVAVRFVLKGVHTGSFFGVPASTRPIEVRANVIMHIVEGRVAKLLGIFDEAGLMRQIST